MEFGKGKYAMLKMKRGKRHRTEGIELPNEDKIRKPGEKKTYKYLKILETNTIKHAEMKEKKIGKNSSRERENYPKPNYLAEI